MDGPDKSNDDHAEPALPKVVAGILAATAGIRLGPGAALAFGAGGVLFEDLAVRSWQEFWPGAYRRDGQMLETAADEAGLDDEELAGLIGSSDRTQLLTALAMAAAERTTWPSHVKALGKVLAAGLIAEDDAVDLPQFALEAMSDLGRLHVNLLDLLVCYEVVTVPGQGLKEMLHTVPSYQPMYLGSPGAANPPEWRVGRRTWTAPPHLFSPSSAPASPGGRGRDSRPPRAG